MNLITSSGTSRLLQVHVVKSRFSFITRSHGPLHLCLSLLGLAVLQASTHPHGHDVGIAVVVLRDE